MNRFRWTAVPIAIAMAWLTLAAVAEAATIVVGPGTHSPISDYQHNDYHFLPGAQIVGPTGQQLVPYIYAAHEAINYGGHGHVRFDGGEFRGGDATYSGPAGSYAEVRSGVAVAISQSTAEIHGGLFRGGKAFSSSASGPATAGTGLLLSQSVATISGGTFVGGDLLTPNAPYYPSNFPRVPDIVVSGSTVHLTGGHASYIVVGTGSQLHVYGRGLQLNGFSIRGDLLDGTSANISAYFDTSDVIILHNVPEPGEACHVALATLLGIWFRPRRNVSQAAPGTTISGFAVADTTSRRVPLASPVISGATGSASAVFAEGLRAMLEFRIQTL